MSEKYTVVDKLRITYEGLFNVTELYKLIDGWLRTKSYDKAELKNVEKVRPEGKFIEIELFPWKKLTDYAISQIRIRIIMTDVKEVEVEREGAKVKMNQGNVHIVFDGYLETDYENRWESKPIFYFLRGIVDKYIYRSYLEGYKDVVRQDVNHLVTQIKSFLNLYRYTETPVTKPVERAEERF